MLGKGVYPYEYMDSWERFNKTLLDKKEFYSNLAKEDITDKNYKYAKKVWEEFKLKTLGDYRDLHLLLLMITSSKTLATNGLKHLNLVLFTFYEHQD